MQNKKSYYAVIPADVRYSKDIPNGAKLLYGEISALCNEKGFCWASNVYFERMYGVSRRTVQNWINSLSDAGFIEVIQKEENQREIYLAHAKNCMGGAEICTGGVQKTARGGCRNLHHNNTVNNTTNTVKRNFSLAVEINKLEESKYRHRQIIGYYLKKVKPDIRTHDQLKQVISRHLRPAKKLEPFDDDQITEGLKTAMKKYDEVTLETILKVVSR